MLIQPHEAVSVTDNVQVADFIEFLI